MEAGELRDLEDKIRAVNFNYSKRVLSPVEIQKLSKIDRLRIINKRDDKISSLILRSLVETFYKILSLSTEFISFVSNKKLNYIYRRQLLTKMNYNKELNSLTNTITIYVTFYTHENSFSKSILFRKSFK